MSVKDNKEEIKKIIDLLKFVLSLDDTDIIKSTIESVIESLDDLQFETKSVDD